MKKIFGKKIFNLQLKIFFILFLLIISLLIGCKNIQQNKVDKQKTLSELQISACNSADAAKTCDTRLAEVGIVLKEDCCGVLRKCC